MNDSEHAQYSLKDIMEKMETGFKETNANFVKLGTRITCVEATQIHMQDSIDDIKVTLGDKVSVIHDRIDKQSVEINQLKQDQQATKIALENAKETKNDNRHFLFDWVSICVGVSALLFYLYQIWSA